MDWGGKSEGKPHCSLSSVAYSSVEAFREKAFCFKQKFTKHIVAVWKKETTFVIDRIFLKGFHFQKSGTQ